MTYLTRRRDSDGRSECWHIYYGDARVGTIGKRAGVPNDVDQWGSQCGFYPTSHSGWHVDGTAATFDRARNEFEAAWASYLPDCTEADIRGLPRAARLDRPQVRDVVPLNNQFR